MPNLASLANHPTRVGKSAYILEQRWIPWELHEYAAINAILLKYLYNHCVEGTKLAGNGQPWQFVIVLSQHIARDLSLLAREEKKRKGEEKLRSYPPSC